MNMIIRTLNITKTKKGVFIYDRLIDNEYKEKQRLEFNLKRCIRENMNGFDVYYQPIVNPDTGIWCGLEALCRWCLPELGFISPLIFIAEAERLTLIEKIGLWVLERAIRDCKAWGLDKYNGFMLTVNVSSVQFNERSFSMNVLDILQKFDYSGSNLCLEITESTGFTFNTQSLKTISVLRDNKILVAIDDFGTGYSNFNNLKNIPVDVIKIEREFVVDIEDNEFHRYLFKIIADLTHMVGMKLIAEGVERESQIGLLKENGVDYMQGY